MNNKTSCSELMIFITEDTKVKHANIPTIYSIIYNSKYLQK